MITLRFRPALSMAALLASTVMQAAHAGPGSPRTGSSEAPSSSAPSASNAPSTIAGTAKCRGHLRQGCRPASYATEKWTLPPFEVDPEPQPTETLAQALAAAYRTAPALQAQRYTLRASDEDYAQALAELRPTGSVQITSTFDRNLPGRTTFGRSPANDSNAFAAQAVLAQPLYTGGRAAADRDAALAGVRAGREQLRGTENDLFLQVITAYADVRRDSETFRLYGANLRQLTATLEEVKARREAGELTLTDVAQAETQVDQAQAQTNSVHEQLEQDRANFAALVGHDAGVLAPPPPLPHVPGSVDQAFTLAEQRNPELAQAIATERQSRARISAAAAQGRPTVELMGTASLNGQAVPFYLSHDTKQFQGQAVLTIPLLNGGRVRSLIVQARDRNAADRIGIESARRQMVDTIVNAWNAIATAERNIEVGARQVTSAKLFDEGTFEEYRAGLRSTFDVLYAHSTLLNAQVELVAARHDLYVAEATLLRRTGLLEADALLTGSGLYDPDRNFQHVAHRDALPWDGAVRAIDRIDRPSAHQQGLEQAPIGHEPAVANEPASLPNAMPVTTSPNVPIPGTVGTPVPDRSLKQP